MIKRIYVEEDNLKPLIDWLKTKPSGECRILVGGKSDTKEILQKVMTPLMKLGRSFGQWLSMKILSQELSIRAIAEKPDDLTPGIVVESEE